MATCTEGGDEDVPHPGGRAVDLEEAAVQLRDVLAALRRGRERLPSRGEAIAPAAAGGEAPEQVLRDVERRLAAAREALDLRRAEEERLRARLVEIEREHRSVRDGYLAARKQTFDVASLFVALSRLHGTLERRGVLAAIQEVVVNMLGSEELAIFELGPAGRLRVVQAMGVDAPRLGEVPVGEGTIGRAALGHAFVVGGAVRSEDPALTACIPLKVGDRVTGALALWRLLGHKPFLNAADLELLELLSTHAGTALYAAELHERHGSRAP